MVFLLEPANVALGVTEELMRLVVTEFGSSSAITGVVEILANPVCGIGETRFMWKIQISELNSRLIKLMCYHDQV